ncbi:MAG: MBL fold metallo-hydrolase, partial [Deltaproteobacteria bacterium]|nr:MBL fold metallo-hydrolase [Deltaproteobacteria bacterium]
PRKINDYLWILGNDYFHIYLIKGKNNCALVETGISATADVTLQQLSLLEAKPDYLIVSHPHSDHITGLDYLKRSFPQAAVMAAKGAESFITHPKAAQSLIAEDIYMIQALTSLGICSTAGTIAAPPSLRGCQVVNDGEQLDLGDLIICFLEVQGHSPGNILVHIPSLNTVLVSDSLGNHYPGRGFFPTFFTGFADYMKTIDCLERLGSINLGLAHNGFFSEQKEIGDIFREARKSARDVQDYVTNSSRDDETIAKDLFGFYYTDELAVYSPQNILNCCRLLVRRVRETDQDKNNRS